MITSHAPMRMLVAGVLFLSCLPLGNGRAQPAPDAGSAQIEQLKRQVQELQRQLDQSKARPATGQTLSPAPVDTAGCMQSASKQIYCPGWIIQVSGGQSSAPAGRFLPSDYGHFSLELHNGLFPFSAQRMAYDGLGMLNVKTPGQYSFIINGKTAREPCSFQLSIDDQPIIDSRGGSASAAVPLPSGIHQIGFHFECIKGGSTSYIYGVRQFPTMDLLVLTPGEPYPRALRADELLHRQTS